MELRAAGGRIGRFWGRLPVKHYRLYYLDRFSGHIDGVEELAAASDEDAIAAALDRSDGRAMELWHRHHKLRHWDEVAPALD